MPVITALIAAVITGFTLVSTVAGTLLPSAGALKLPIGCRA